MPSLSDFKYDWCQSGTFEKGQKDYGQGPQKGKSNIKRGKRFTDLKKTLKSYRT